MFSRVITVITRRNLSFLNNSNSFLYNETPRVKNIINSSNKKRFFSTSLTNSKTNQIIDSPTHPPTFSETFPDTVPENLPTNNVNFIISFNQSILEFIQNSTGFPWWATILISTLFLRTFLTLPIAIIQQKSNAKLLSLQPQIMESFEKLKHEVVREVKKRNGTYEEFQSELTKRFKAKTNEIYKANKCSPIRNYLLPWVQIPLFISNSLTLRHMVNSTIKTTKSNSDTNTNSIIPDSTIISSTPGGSNIDTITNIDNNTLINGGLNTNSIVPDSTIIISTPEGSNIDTITNISSIDNNTLINGGLLWFNDLTITDPTLIFPLAIGFVNLINIEIHSRFTKSQPSLRSKILKNLSRGLSILMIPVATQAPMAICLYWLSSSIFSVGQNLIFELPFVQKKFGFSEKKIDISSTLKTEKDKEALEPFKKNNNSMKMKKFSLKNKKKKEQ